MNRNSVINGDCFDIIKTIDKNSIDLILIDPPYIISKKSSFHKSSNNANKELKRKYKNVSNDFGDWDKIEIDWNLLFNEFNRILKNGGSIIIFYDIWKSNIIKEAATLNKFNQHRVGCWNKTNPLPINSNINYLSNANEYFFTFVKGKKPTFNSIYDNGIYKFPFCNGNERYKHPTQKPLDLIKSLIKKHSNQGDLILDCFAGTGTTAHAAFLLKRDYIVIEKEKSYYDIIIDRLNKI